MFGDFNNKRSKKVSKEGLAKKAVKQTGDSFSGYQFKQPEIIARGKKKNF